MTIRAIICDYDGVVDRTATLRLMKACHLVLKPHHPMEFEAFSELFRSLVPFPMFDALQFILNAFGLPHIQSSVLSAIHETRMDPSEAFPLIEACRTAGIEFYIYSASQASDPKFVALERVLPPGHIISNPRLSKVDVKQFGSLAQRLSLDPKDALYIDDCPNALTCAKAAGFQTAWMRGPVFEQKPQSPWLSQADHTISSLIEVVALLGPVNTN